MIYIIIYKHGNEIDHEYYFSTHLSVFESYIVFEPCVINVLTVFYANIILLYQLTIIYFKGASCKLFSPWRKQRPWQYASCFEIT